MVATIEINVNEKLRSKLLKKIKGLLRRPQIDFFDRGTGKRALIKKPFQVLGKLYSLEVGFTHKLENEAGEFFIKEEFYLIRYNSRSTEGGITFHAIDDIANNLGITNSDVNEMLERLKALSRMNERELEKAKSVYIKRVEKSAKKITA